MSFQELPAELFELILLHLASKELYSLLRTSRLCYQRVPEPLLYRNIFIRLDAVGTVKLKRLVINIVKRRELALHIKTLEIGDDQHPLRSAYPPSDIYPEALRREYTQFAPMLQAVVESVLTTIGRTLKLKWMANLQSPYDPDGCLGILLLLTPNLERLSIDRESEIDKEYWPLTKSVLHAYEEYSKMPGLRSQASVYRLQAPVSLSEIIRVSGLISHPVLSPPAVVPYPSVRKFCLKDSPTPNVLLSECFEIETLELHEVGLAIFAFGQCLKGRKFDSLRQLKLRYRPHSSWLYGHNFEVQQRLDLSSLPAILQEQCSNLQVLDLCQNREFAGHSTFGSFRKFQHLQHMRVDLQDVLPLEHSGNNFCLEPWSQEDLPDTIQVIEITCFGDKHSYQARVVSALLSDLSQSMTLDRAASALTHICCYFDEDGPTNAEKYAEPEKFWNELDHLHYAFDQLGIDLQMCTTRADGLMQRSLLNSRTDFIWLDSGSDFREED